MASFPQKLRKLTDTVFKQRTYSTIVMVVLVGCMLWIGPIAIESVLGLAAIGLVYEWVRMCKLHKIAAFIFILLVILGSLVAAYMQRDKLAFGILFIGGSFGVLMSWFAWQRHFLWITFGLLYIGVPILSMFWICENIPQSTHLFFWIVTIVSSNDIFAYLTGNLIGGPKLIPEISPKKTWSGLAGGLLAAVLLGYFSAPTGLPKYQILLASFIIAILANLGDFFESFIKRLNHVKDSGTIIPGHGGLFDRMDGLLLVFPFVAWICIQSPALLMATNDSFGTTQLKKEI